MKAILLARVSTDEQADALQGQVNRLEAYASTKQFQPSELHKFQESAWSDSAHQQMMSVINSIENEQTVVALVLDKVDRLFRLSGVRSAYGVSGALLTRR